MKRVFSLIALSMLLARPLVAQDTSVTPAVAPANTAATIAAREDAEERYKRMAADLQAVQSDNETLHAKIASMETELQSLRDAQARPADTSAVQDQIKHLAEKIEEVDKKRLEDKDVISEEIRKSIGKLESTLTGTPAPPVVTHESRPKPSPVVDTPAAAENGYSYTVADGDRLDLIVKAYNKEFRSKGLKPITMKQAKDANPNVNWNRLLVGQKIVIPRPDGG